jgi:hypothetical protein
MTTAEKFAALTPAQQEKMESLKDSTEFDAFLRETGLDLTDEEKSAAISLIESGLVPLSDDEMDDIAGGKSWGKKLKRAIMRTL